MAISSSPPAPVLEAPASGYAQAPREAALPLAGVHVGALDGIRGFAVLLVLYYHYGSSALDLGFQGAVLQASAFGWIGVDLFFVLSGFLITGILYDAKRSENYFRNFYARRSLRIFPLYYLALVVVLAMAALWPDAGVWPEFNPLWFVFYLSNVAMVVSNPDDAGILGHFWSLAIEEHFYLLWPAIVLIATRRQLMAIAAALLLGSLSLRVMLYATGSASPDAFYFLTPLRFDALAVGAICSLAVRGGGGLPSLARPAWIAMLGGGMALFVMILLTRSLSYYSGAMHTFGFTLLAFTFGGMLLVTLSFKPANHVFSYPMLRWFGRYSYGIYVWHPIINVILFYTSLKAALGVDSPTESALYIAFAFALTIVVSLASYHFWEKKFLALKGRFHDGEAREPAKAAARAPSPAAG